MLSLVWMVLLCYVAGSIPTSIIVSKALRGIDIRDYGSGNAGATNVHRVMGLGPAILVSAVDIGKGAAAVLLISRIAQGAPVGADWTQIFAGLAAISGHIWSVFAGFRGGKGVNTAAGVLVALAPLAVVIGLVVWLAVVFITRYVSVASMSAAVALSAALFAERFAFKGEVSVQVLALGCVATVLIFVTHRSNISRLLRGVENRTGQSRSPESADPSEKS